MKDIASYIAQNRFGLGATHDGADIGADPRGWVKAQITGRRPAQLSGFRASADILAEIQVARAEGRDAQRAASRNAYRSDFATETLARAQLMVDTPAPFAERMVLFWSNHFTVANTKPLIGPMIPAYEREAIRPHIFGRFADMLKAAIRHPGML